MPGKELYRLASKQGGEYGKATAFSGFRKIGSSIPKERVPGTVDTLVGRTHSADPYKK
jgi:hypothetical protein